ncbi:MAG: hypothetical protein NZO58_10230, partial [Gemmataceae bacterium]|nr:hypothetical protein [Gemmataceae bacterium]
RITSTEIGTPYRVEKGVKAPVKLHISDPLQRLRSVDLEVWSEKAAAPGTPRPAGVNEREYSGLAIRDGIVTTDIDFPEINLGSAVWLQATLVDDKGRRLSAPSIAVLFNDEPPLERIPTTFKLSQATVPERTVVLESTRIEQFSRGVRHDIDVRRVEATVLEHVHQAVGGFGIELHPGTVRVRGGSSDKPADLAALAGAIVERLMFRFQMNEQGGVTPRGRPYQISLLPAPLKEEINSVYDNLTYCYEAVGITLPRHELKPLETWTAKVPIRAVAGGQAPSADMHLTCTYEGCRVRDKDRFALVKIVGDVRGRGTKSDMGGYVDGHLLFDLERGFIANVQLMVQAEQHQPAVTVKTIWNVQVTRDAGNPQQIGRIDPKAPLPDPKTLAARPPVRPIAKGNTVLKVADVLTPADKTDKKTVGAHYKEYFVKLDAGTTYVIEMNHDGTKGLDPFLRLETLDGVVLAFDDDGGGDLNARIVYTARRSGNFKIIATTFDPQQVGPFTLVVSEVAQRPANGQSK